MDAALAEALVRKLVTLEAVQARATGKLAMLVTTAAPTKSKLERDLRKLLHDHGLPQPVSNGLVCGYHGHRRAFESDRLRDQTLLVAGWPVARVTDLQLSEQRAATAARFAALLRDHPPSRTDHPPTRGVGTR